MRPVHRHPGLTIVAALLAGLFAAAAGAQEEESDGRFEIRNAFVERVDDTWLLDVRLDLALADAARQAFTEGVPLVLELEVEATTERRFLPDETVVSFTRQWQLAYDALSERYVVTDSASGEHESHTTEAEALESLSRMAGIPVADVATLPPDARFDMQVRASIGIDDLPDAIRILLFWMGWSRSTDWYIWRVRP